MSKILIMTLALLGILSTACEAKEMKVKITSVTDGDTFKFTQGKVRVLGIDCPESSANKKCIRNNGSKKACKRDEVPRGQEAKQKGKELLQGQTVTLVSGGMSFEYDKYSRMLAYVKLSNGADYGLAMLQMGLCRDYSDRYPHPRQNLYKKEQR